MPSQYYINTDLGFVLYVCKGMISPSEFYARQDEAIADQLYREGMPSVFDFLEGEIDVDLNDMKLALNWSQNKQDQGIHLGPAFILTTNTTLRLLIKTMNLLSNLPGHFVTVCDGIEDFIAQSELQDHEQEVLEFWYSCKKQKQPIQ